jgi:hypothetical protein
MLNYLWDKYKTPIYMTENVSGLHGALVAEVFVLTRGLGYAGQGRERHAKGQSVCPEHDRWHMRIELTTAGSVRVTPSSPRQCTDLAR